jgi:very-short-patch-repair endonuclease
VHSIEGQLPPAIDVILGNEIYIAKDGLSPWLRNELVRLAAFQNQEFYKAQAMIPFDGQGRMEVDLLCEASRMAIAVAGALHLGDAEAYRRDRHKDRLLQEHGYTVLRFLAEDLAKDLDIVLDAILRALATRVSVQCLRNCRAETE